MFFGLVDVLLSVDSDLRKIVARVIEKANKFLVEMATPKERVSAKWTDANDLVFIELCLIEIGKGNRSGTSLSKEGWKNVVKDFNTRTGSKLDQKQLKNRWDLMKKEWSLYKNLMRSYTGIGWDPIKNTIDASDDWWEEQITVNKAYKKFRNRDLTIVASKYDELFRGTVTIGMGARASTQRSAVGVRIDGEDLSFPYIEVDANIQAEGSGDSDEICPAETLTQPTDPLFPPSLVFKKGSNNGSKRKRANTSSIKEGIQSLLNIAISKSTETSAYVAPPYGPTFDQCMTLLNGLDGIEMYSGLYYFSASLFYKSGNRQIFMSHIDDRARVGWLSFKFAKYERGH